MLGKCIFFKIKYVRIVDVVVLGYCIYKLGLGVGLFLVGFYGDDGVLW